MHFHLEFVPRLFKGQFTLLHETAWKTNRLLGSARSVTHVSAPPFHACAVCDTRSCKGHHPTTLCCLTTAWTGINWKCVNFIHCWWMLHEWKGTQALQCTTDRLMFVRKLQYQKKIVWENATPPDVHHLTCRYIGMMSFTMTKWQMLRLEG